MADCEYILPWIKPGWVGVEIGVCRGHSARRLLEHGVSFLYLIDPFSEHEDYLENMPHADNYAEALASLSGFPGRFEIHRMTSAEASALVPQVDFVWIDGNHRYEYVKSDMELYFPKVRNGGILCGHDYCISEPYCQVKPAVDDFVAARGLRLQLPQNSWLIQKGIPRTEVHLAGPTAPEKLRLAFLDAVARPTSIHQLLTIMRDTASGCQHITEMGVGEGFSTLSWLIVQPRQLVCYDIGPQRCAGELHDNRGSTEIDWHFGARTGNSLKVDIEETDLLFLDTCHNYLQLKAELARHHAQVRKYILMHDTTTFADHGEDNQPPGLWLAITEFLADHPEWYILQRFMHNNGLTILQRK
jgi:hypothetical protein